MLAFFAFVIFFFTLASKKVKQLSTNVYNLNPNYISITARKKQNVVNSYGQINNGYNQYTYPQSSVTNNYNNNSYTQQSMNNIYTTNGYQQATPNNFYNNTSYPQQTITSNVVKYCNNCGNKVIGKYCDKCGKQV